MKCDEVLNQYFEENITDIERNRLEDHVSTCPFCQDTLRASDQIGAFVRNIDPIEKSDEFFTNLLLKINNTIDERVADNRTFLYKIPAVVKRTVLLAAAAVLLLFAMNDYQIRENEKIVQEMQDEADAMFQEHSMISESMFLSSGSVVTYNFSAKNTKNKARNKTKNKIIKE